MGLLKMIKNINEKSKKIELDLTGPDGNAFALLGYASKFAKQLGLDDKEITSEMMSGDYEHLVYTFEKKFGTFVILYR